MLDRLPFAEQLLPYREELLAKLGEWGSSLGGAIVGALSNTTIGTLQAVFQTFILVYTMFFLLLDGPQILQAMRRFLPLREGERDLLLDKFVSVTRATLKGTLVIGAVQGTLAGVAFWVAGVEHAVFWGAIMVVLSVVPMLGGALVWVPTCIVLALTGHWVKAVALAAFCGLVVGSIDNVLRPRLVGRDTEMHDLMILFSTLGGIIVFGPIGFIIGPIIAALFQTSWELFGLAFADNLPALATARGGRARRSRVAPTDPPLVQDHDEDIVAALIVESAGGSGRHLVACHAQSETGSPRDDHPRCSSSACTRRLMSSRIARTSSMGRPLGSGKGQSSRKRPGTCGQASPHPIVTSIVAPAARSSVSNAGCACDRSMPSSLHRLDDDRMHVRAGRRARRYRLGTCRIRGGVEEGGGHLRPAGIVDAGEDDASRRGAHARGLRGTAQHPATIGSS